MKQYECKRCKIKYFKDGVAYNINDYHHIVCEPCEKLFEVLNQEFIIDFIQPERSKREDIECCCMKCSCNSITHVTHDDSCIVHK